MVKLMSDSISHGIHRLVIIFDLQLVVLQLANVYLVRSPTILHMFLSVHLLQRDFDFILYQHIYGNPNILMDTMANHVLDRHL